MSHLVANIWQSAKENGLILLGTISLAFSIVIFSLFSTIQPEKMAKGIVEVHVVYIGIADNWDGVGTGIIPAKKFDGKSKKDTVKPQKVNNEN